MSGIAGIVSFDGRPIDREAFARMMLALSPRGRDGQASVLGEDFALGNAMFHTTPESSLEQQPLRFEHFIITADARIDNRDELLDELDVPKPEQDKLSDAGVIVRAYAKWKRGAPYKLEGNFAFAIWDLHEKRLFCARDVFGARPFCFTKLPWGFVFASDTMAMRRSQLFNLTINEARFADAMTPVYIESLHVHETLWNEIERLRSQTWLEVHHNQLTKQVYFRFAETHVDLPKSDDDKIALFHDEFVRSVDRCLRSVGPVGLTLTGGLDSGSIACVARRLLAERGLGPLRAYSALVGGPQCTETPGVNAIMAGGGIDLNVIGPNDAEEMGDVFLGYMDASDNGPFDPFVSPVWLGPYSRAAAAGTRVVLDGRDGALVAGGPANALSLAFDEADFAAFCRLATEKYTGGHALSAQSLDWTARAMSHWVQLRVLARVSPTGFTALRRLRAAASARRWLDRSGVSAELAARAALLERFGAVSQVCALRPLYPSHAVSQPFDQLGYVVQSMERADRCGAYLGVEPRAPFFDRRLVTLGVHMPWRLTASTGLQKPLLRRAMASEPGWTCRDANSLAGAHLPLRREILGIPRARAWHQAGLTEAQRRPHFFATPLTGRSDYPPDQLLARQLLHSLGARWLMQYGQGEQGQLTLGPQ